MPADNTGVLKRSPPTTVSGIGKPCERDAVYYLRGFGGWERVCERDAVICAGAAALGSGRRGRAGWAGGQAVAVAGASGRGVPKKTRTPQ